MFDKKIKPIEAEYVNFCQVISDQIATVSKLTKELAVEKEQMKKEIALIHNKKDSRNYKYSKKHDDRKPNTKLTSLAVENINLLSMHGIARIVNSKNNCMILFRLMVFLISFGFCIFWVYKIVDEYLKFKTVTVSESVNIEGTHFPAVYVCAKNQKHLGTINFTVSGMCENSNGKIPSINVEKIPFTFKHSSFNCLRINAEKSKVYALEAQNCLRLKIYNGKNSYFFVTNRYENYIDNMFSRVSDRIKLEPGFHHDFTLSKTVTNKLERPYSNCSNSIANYQANNCMMKCYTEKIIERYNCTFEGYDQLEGYSVCGQVVDKRKEARPACLEACPLECEFTEYFVSSSKFPKDGTRVETTVYVSFASSNYLRIKEVPLMTSESFISNVGGTLGLFLGMSFLSFIEILEFFLLIFHYIFQKN